MRKLLLAASAAAFVWAGVVFVSGGVVWHIGEIVLRSRDPRRSLMLAVVLLVLRGALYRETVRDDTERAAALVRRGAGVGAVGLVLLLVCHTVRFGTFSVGGADAYGYVSQAYGWARGELPRPARLPITLPFPSGDLMLTPLGYRLGPEPRTIVPTYAPGLPLMMAVAALTLGACGPFLIVPVCAALLVWLTYTWGRHTAGPAAGFIASLVIVTSPIVLYQSLWPMSDVPAGTLWTGAAVTSLLRGTRWNALATGLWTAAGLLVRPNLLLLTLVPLGQVAAGARGRERWIRVVLFCAGVIPAALLIATLNAMWYGAPWHSGYGSAADLYSIENISVNVRRYSGWLLQSQSWWVLLAVVPLLPVMRRYAEPTSIRLAVVMVAVTLLCYVGYAPFDAWWYLRFMLPAMGAVAVLIGAGIVAIARQIPQPWGRVAAGCVLWLTVLSALRFAVGVGVFGGSKAGELRYVDIGRFVGRTLPDNALIFTMQHSGNIRFYGGRLTIRYDFLDKDWASRATAELERLGYHPYMVIDDWEAPYVRNQFGFAPDSPLPWQVFARMRELGGLTVFDMATRAHSLTPTSLEPEGRAHCAAPLPVTIKAR